VLALSPRETSFFLRRSGVHVFCCLLPQRETGREHELTCFVVKNKRIDLPAPPASLDLFRQDTEPPWMMETVCCVDMGTTQIKVGLVNDSGCVLSSARFPVPEFVKWNGFLSFDTEQYESTVFQAIREARDGCGHLAPRIEAVVLF
jgi:hypothetical protein